MNAVEIESAISELADEPFNPTEFPFAFLAAFGHKETTLKRLRAGNSNSSDITGGVLLRNNIHIMVVGPDEVSETLTLLRDSAATKKAKAKFILVTDGEYLEAEDLGAAEQIACKYTDFPNHFGFFLPLAGITTIKEISDNPIDVRATGRLNKLYVELLRENPDWASEERRPDMNHFMARLIFCFFAEDTDIFKGQVLFTQTVDQYSDRDGSNTHEILETLFLAMNTKLEDRKAAGFRPWADKFPYVNGGLFSGNTEVPRFTRMARTYFMHAGNLNWREINPDIFGSMIQAVADDEERGSLGMHYTNASNIKKVLNPLFLDDLRIQLEEAGYNERKLLNLRKRIAKIRVFDPACGSGNFLVIAYKLMREIEAEINRRRQESHMGSTIPLTNFRGIEIRDFPAEIARLALIIAEFQCDVLYRGQQEALDEFLPLDTENWIVCGNALRIDWLSVCPPSGTGVKIRSDDLLGISLEQPEIDFKNEGGETYICGNPPYLGSTWQNKEQKADLQSIFEGRIKNWKSLDYVAAWFMKASDYGLYTKATSAFVSTNSICQGQQVAILWSKIFEYGTQIVFAHTSFKWSNLASKNAGVTVVIVGISSQPIASAKLFTVEGDGDVVKKICRQINAYLVADNNVIIDKAMKPLTEVSEMTFGSKPVDGGNLLLTQQEMDDLALSPQDKARFIRQIYGSDEFIGGKQRYCIWVTDADAEIARNHPIIGPRLEAVKKMRLASTKLATRRGAEWSHRFDERRQLGDEKIIVVPAVSSENREYLPCGLLSSGTIITNRNFGIFNGSLWNLGVLCSRIHWVWIDAVCGKLEMRFNYSNTLGWNTFPIPFLTDKNKVDLTATAENILLAREAHYPATIAGLYDPEKIMPDNLRRAHEQNDEVLERIYIGRRFKNDTERLEKLFDLYTKMTAAESAKPAKAERTK